MKTLKKYVFPLWGEAIIVLFFFVVQNNWTNTRNNIIEADGRGYYEFLPATFIYNDLSLSYLDTLNTDYYDRSVITEFYPRLENGKRYDKYFIGTAILQSPFFAIGHGWAKYSGYKVDGFSKPYQKSISFAGLFYSMLGLLFIRLLLGSYDVNRFWIFVMQFGLVFCSSLLNYMHWDAAYSHLYSFFLISGFLYFARNFIVHKGGKSLFWGILFLAFIFMVRPVNILVILFLPILSNDFKQLVFSLKSVFNGHLKTTLFAVLLAACLYQIQCLIWYQQTGNWFHYSYGEETFKWTEPHFIEFLFSYRKGFFLWAPWFFISVMCGIAFHILKKDWYRLIAFLGSFSLLVYVLSSWWYWSYGGSMGSRPMIDFYPAIIAFVAPVLARKPDVFKWIIFMVTPLFAFLLITQVYQYQKGILKWDLMTKEDYWKIFLKKEQMYEFYIWKTEIQTGEEIIEKNWIKHQVIGSEIDYSDTMLIENSSGKMAKVGQITFESRTKTNAETMEIILLDLNDSLIMNHRAVMLHRIGENKNRHKVNYTFPVEMILPEEFKAVFMIYTKESPVTIDSMKMRFFTD